MREPPAAAASARAAAARSLAPILSRPAFFLLLIGSMASIGAVGGTMQNLALYLSLDRKLAQVDVDATLSLILIGSLVGRLFMGWLADRVAKKRVMILIYVIVAAAIPPLFYAPTPATLKMFAFVFGIGLGGDYMIIPLMAAELYGVAIMGRVMGIVLTADSVAESVVPMIVAGLRDSTGSYGPGFMVLVGLAAVGAIAVSLLPGRPGAECGGVRRVVSEPRSGRAGTGGVMGHRCSISPAASPWSSAARAASAAPSRSASPTRARTWWPPDGVATWWSKAAAEIRARGRRSLTACADVADVASMTALRDTCLRDLGRIDIVVAAAGVTKRVPTLQMDEADWDRIIETNLTGVLRTCQVFGAPMVEQKRGRIITIASLASFIGLHEVAAYTASKAGVAGLTRALAVEWAPAWRDGQCDRAGRVRDRFESRAPEIRPRPGVPGAHADGAIRPRRRARRRRGVPGVGCRQLHYRPVDRG